MDVYLVRAHWDDEAKVWWAESDDVPGLASEAPSFEQLDENVRAIAPELLALNKGVKGTFRINLMRE
jgi:predicted RNase H-like HicB family nuclease